MTVSRMVHNGFPKEEILAEMAKCDVLCTKCHKKIHSKHRGRRGPRH